jgi:hypothetical protein
MDRIERLLKKERFKVAHKRDAIDAAVADLNGSVPGPRHFVLGHDVVRKRKPLSAAACRRIGRGVHNAKLMKMKLLKTKAA